MIQAALLEFEQHEIKDRSQYKFGVLYLKPGQERDEDKIYSNGTSPHNSPLSAFLLRFHFSSPLSLNFPWQIIVILLW